MSLRLITSCKTIDYQKEQEVFFNQCSKNDSKHTMRLYKNGLRKLEAYLKNTNINILKLIPHEADDFGISLKQTNSSNATVRCNIKLLYFLFIFRTQASAIKNPFRGARTRSPIRNKKEVLIPTEAELDLIISHIKNITIKTAIIFMHRTDSCWCVGQSTH